MQNQEKWTSNQEKQRALSDYALSFVDKTLDMQERRYLSIQESASHVSTGISVVALSLTASLAYLEESHFTFVLSAFPLAVTLLLISLALLLLIQFRFKYNVHKSPMTIYGLVIGDRDKFRGEYDIVWQYCDTAEEIYNGLKARSDKMNLVLKVATVIAAFGIVIICIAIFLQISCLFQIAAFTILL